MGIAMYMYMYMYNLYRLLYKDVCILSKPLRCCVEELNVVVYIRTYNNLLVLVHVHVCLYDVHAHVCSYT